jgi:hypothetical protein
MQMRDLARGNVNRDLAVQNLLGGAEIEILSHAAITTVATQFPIRLPSARAIPTNQSTENTKWSAPR